MKSNELGERGKSAVSWSFLYYNAKARHASSMDTPPARYCVCHVRRMRRLFYFSEEEMGAGIPGMVAGMLRHMNSLRLLRHDNGWIHTLLEEAENERMHLMTFLNMKQPSMIFRAGVLAAQGVFFNAFFFTYLISPRTCHRFVGYLEEEAVRTYTHAINDIDSGGTDARQWAKERAPKLAIEY